MERKKEKPTKLGPPKWANKFLNWYCNAGLLDEIEGDLYEAFFIRIEKYGLRKAQFLYIKEVLLFAKPSSFKQLKPNIMPSLIRNHFKIATRNLFRQKGYSIISIGGLAIALSLTLLMLLWVQDEWNTDKFHTNGDRLFLLKRTVPQVDGRVDVQDKVPYLLLQAAKNDLPEVEHFIPLGWQEEVTLTTGKKTFRAKGISSNAAFFESFSFPILSGTVDDLGKGRPTIAITESLADKFFGQEWSEHAVGSTISMNDVDTFAVSAVYADFPANSSMEYDFIYSFDSFLGRFEWMMNWQNSGAEGALLLTEGANKTEVAQKLEKIFQSHLQGDLKESCILHEFEDSYLYGQFNEEGKAVGGRIEYVQMFALAALLLLIISCINFINLATARASKRAKEVGVRKTIGAGKGSLVAQFMVEAGVITTISVGIGLLLAQLALPRVQLITEKMLQFDYSAPIFWASIGAILFLTTLLSGIYPAFVLSSFRPTEVLKGKTQSKAGGIGLRKGLVITQFVLALLLVVSAFVIKEQVQYIQEKNLGINKNNLITIERGTEISENYDLIKDKLLKAPGIEQVTIGPSSPLDIPSSTTGVSWPGKQQEDQNLEFRHFWAASNFLETVDVTLVAGRFYREDAPFDSTNIVLNEKAVEVMGLEEPVGQIIQWWGQRRQIIGVVENFHIQSLYEDIKPLGIHLSTYASGVLIKAKDGEMKAAIGSLQTVFNELLPEFYLHYNFVDTEYQQQYKSEVLMGTLANYFAIISIFIACLGLLGLSAFLAEQKVKEISIRKVLGASMGDLVSLLSKDFLMLVGIGLLLGIPISWYLLNGWLTNFAYAIELEWWMFALPILMAILITGITITAQATRAVINSPIDALRSE